MTKSENRNLCVYIGDKIRHRKDYGKDFRLVSKSVKIMGLGERKEGGLILYLQGNHGEEYSFELEKISLNEGKIASKGEGVRRQFLDDIGVWNILDNIWDLDYKGLIGKTIEAFVHKKGQYVVAVSPIFMPLQKIGRMNAKVREHLEKTLENLLAERLKVIIKINSEIDNLGEYKDSLGILNTGRNHIQSSVRDALAIKQDYMLATGQTQVFEAYYQFINKAARVLKKININLESLEQRKGLNQVLDEINFDDDNF